MTERSGFLFSVLQWCWRFRLCFLDFASQIVATVGTASFLFTLLSTRLFCVGEGIGDGLCCPPLRVDGGAETSRFCVGPHQIARTHPPLTYFLGATMICVYRPDGRPPYRGSSSYRWGSWNASSCSKINLPAALSSLRSRDIFPRVPR